jgi:predicted phage terminase large subunit-like protein
MSAPETVTAGQVAAAWRAAAAWNDVAFAEYVSGLRYPSHLRRLVSFAHAHSPGACGVLLPRGHAKTTAAIHMVARLIGEREGRVKVLIATASEADALKRSTAIRGLVASPRFAQVFGWAWDGVAGERWTEAAWTVRGAEAYVEKDATLRAGSLLGLKPGARADVLICDDLVGPDENANPRARAKALDRYLAVIDPMLTPDARVLFLGTRWHEDDLYRALLDRGVPFFTEQALSEEGVALWPERWPAAKLAAKRDAMGSTLFNLQYQNDPSGMGGNVFRREWYRDVDTLPPGSRRAGMDLASSEKERSDYTAVVEWWEDAENNLYAIGAYQARLDEGHRLWLTGVDDDGEIPPGNERNLLSGPRFLWPCELLPPSAAIAGHHQKAPRPLTTLKIEAVTFQSTFVRELLAKTRLPASAVHPDKDKVTRARTLAARMEAGKVFFLRGAPGIEMLKAQMTAFPNGEHDDLVDAAVYGADLGGSDFYFTSGNR